MKIKQWLAISVAITGIALPVLAQNRTAPMNFAGRYLVSISDADMVASAYIDGNLGSREGEDVISVIPVGKHVSQLEAFEAPASNSVAGPPVAVAVTPDGRYAMVVETFTPRPEGAAENQTFADLEQGNRIKVFDLQDPTSPSLVQERAIAERPDAVSINFDGSLVAVSFHPSGAGTETPIGLIPFSNGQLGEPVYPNLSSVPQGDRLIHAEWHPTENVLALVNETAAEVSFARLSDSLALEPWGNTVKIEKAPYMGCFTPDGRHFIVNNLFWGSDVEGTWTEAPKGSINSIRLSAGTGENGTPRHALISRSQTGVSPEGIAISPDGR